MPQAHKNGKSFIDRDRDDVDVREIREGIRFIRNGLGDLQEGLFALIRDNRNEGVRYIREGIDDVANGIRSVSNGLDDDYERI